MYGMGPPLNQCPVFAHFLILLGLIHDADYERGAYFLERGCLTRFNSWQEQNLPRLHEIREAWDPFDQSNIVILYA